MSIRVLLVTNLCSHYRVGLFEELARRFHVQFVFFSDGREHYREKPQRCYGGGFTYVYLRGFYLTSHARVTPGLISYALVKRYDVMVKCLNGRFALPVSYLSARLRRRPFVLWTGMWQHPETLFHRLSFPLARRIYLGADAIVVYGRHVADYLASLGVASERIFVAPNSIDNARFNRAVTEQEVADLGAELGVTGKSVVLAVGRCQKEKGLDVLIRAFRKLRSPDAALVIVGEGPELVQLQQLASGDPRVRFVPRISNEELVVYYAMATMFVLPSVWTKTFAEPWGLVVNEAMNQATPVVATTAVGAAAHGLVEHGKTGLVVEPGDVEGLRAAMSRLLSDDILRAELGREAKQRICDYSFGAMADGFEQAINHALGCRGVLRFNLAGGTSGLERS
jgi:glycosyltransferase involved in cell wall biosynthesis